MKTNTFSKTYGKRCVLELPELELPEGQITAVIGPNGSGKSTFAKILAGIERPDGKKPILSGVSVGYLPQKSFPFRMSTEKNILTNGTDRDRALVLMKALSVNAPDRYQTMREFYSAMLETMPKPFGVSTRSSEGTAWRKASLATTFVSSRKNGCLSCEMIS